MVCGQFILASIFKKYRILFKHSLASKFSSKLQSLYDIVSPCQPVCQRDGVKRVAKNSKYSMLSVASQFIIEWMRQVYTIKNNCFQSHGFCCASMFESLIQGQNNYCVELRSK